MDRGLRIAGRVGRGVCVSGFGAGLDGAEFRVGLYPAIHRSQTGIAFDAWTFGWTHPAGAPLLMFEFAPAFVHRMSIAVTSSMSGVYDWYGEICVVLTLMDGVHVTIGYGSSAWLNVGAGLTTMVECTLGFIHRNAGRRLL